MSVGVGLPPANKLPFSFSVEFDGKVENYVLRLLEITDFGKGFKELLAELSDPGELSAETFEATFKSMEIAKTPRIVVVEDVASGKVVCSASLLQEQKFLRNCKKVGHIEDVVTSKDYRRRGLAKMVLNQLLADAKEQGECYKVILDCTEENSVVYGKLGMFKTGEIQMRYNL